eukprot:scaffold254529_cov39-Tisochrysis_lutea.AAC.1
MPHLGHRSAGGGLLHGAPHTIHGGGDCRYARIHAASHGRDALHRAEMRAATSPDVPMKDRSSLG